MINYFLETFGCGYSLSSCDLNEEFLADAGNVLKEIQLKVNESLYTTENANLDLEK